MIVGANFQRDYAVSDYAIPRWDSPLALNHRWHQEPQISKHETARGVGLKF